MTKFVHIAANRRGRDFAVGDIHGHFERLRHALDRLGFDATRDRLFSVGDLVDRGPQSEDCLDWLAQPWFFAVQGNHEALAIQLQEGRALDLETYRRSGGAWLLDASAEKVQRYAECFRRMPIALEVETRQGLVGIVHADCPFAEWSRLRAYLQGKLPTDTRTDQVYQWSRMRLKRNDRSGVRDVRAVIVGHTPVRVPKRLGNVVHIDTAGWSEGYFSFVALDSLEILPRERPEQGPLGA